MNPWTRISLPLLALALALAACAHRAPEPALPIGDPAPPALEPAPLELPEMTAVELTPIARFDCPALNESSGLVQSRTWDEVYWSHNDSGDEARIFAMKRDGTPLQPEWVEECRGIRIGDAVNVDWEDIAIDGEGNLILGALGNNISLRRDLALYVLPEPHPLGTSLTRISHRYRFRYPDQEEFPPPKEEQNFDCEAVFWAEGKIYLATKRRGDQAMALYRFDRLDPLAMNEPVLQGILPVGDLVTAADCAPDGSRLVLLSYGALWLLEPPPGTDRFLEGRVSWLPIEAGQCEAVCFSGEEILITNEEGALFSVAPEDLVVVREMPGAGA